MRMFFAGSDNVGHVTAIMAGGGGCFLASYFHSIKDQTKSKGHKEWAKCYRYTSAHGGDWIMDSGLFTMMFGAGKGKKYTEADLLAYTDQYLEDMKRIGYRHTVVEMDVHKILGMKSLPLFREKFEKVWGVDRTIFVWHVEEGIEGLKALARRYPYIALSIPELRIVTKHTGGSLRSRIQGLVGIIRQENPKVKIHLLGCTQISYMEMGGIWSCDSSSWLQAAIFGWTTEHSLGKVPKFDRRCPWAKALYAKHAETAAKRTFLAATLCKVKVKRSLFLEGAHINEAVNAMAYYELNRHINLKFYHNTPPPTVMGPFYDKKENTTAASKRKDRSPSRGSVELQSQK